MVVLVARLFLDEDTGLEGVGPLVVGADLVVDAGDDPLDGDRPAHQGGDGAVTLDSVDGGDVHGGRRLGEGEPLRAGGLARQQGREEGQAPCEREVYHDVPGEGRASGPCQRRSGPAVVQGTHRYAPSLSTGFGSRQGA